MSKLNWITRHKPMLNFVITILYHLVGTTDLVPSYDPNNNLFILLHAQIKTHAYRQELIIFTFHSVNIILSNPKEINEILGESIEVNCHY